MLTQTPSAAGALSPQGLDSVALVIGAEVGRYGLDEARTLEGLAEQARLSYSLDEACLLGFPRRDLTADETEDTRHGRPLRPARIDGVYAATAPDGQVIALLQDGPSRTKNVVVLRPATL